MDPKAIPEIQLRIPGPWTTHDAFADALRHKSTGYAMDDQGLFHIASGLRIQMSVTEHDDQIAGIFEDTGRLSKREIKAIQQHNVKVHITGPGGSVANARTMMDAASAIAKAGGAGVFVDNSGCAHGVDDWLKLAGDPQPGGLYWAYVAVTAAPDEVWSCGMQCLGFRDASLPDPPPNRELAGFIVHNFLGYVYQSGMEIKDGDTLGGETGAMFRAVHTECTRFEPDSPWFNPFGIWRLEPILDDILDEMDEDSGPSMN